MFRYVLVLMAIVLSWSCEKEGLKLDSILVDQGLPRGKQMNQVLSKIIFQSDWGYGNAETNFRFNKDGRMLSWKMKSEFYSRELDIKREKLNRIQSVVFREQNWDGHKWTFSEKMNYVDYVHPQGNLVRSVRIFEKGKGYVDSLAFLYSGATVAQISFFTVQTNAQMPVLREAYNYFYDNRGNVTEVARYYWSETYNALYPYLFHHYQYDINSNPAYNDDDVLKLFFGFEFVSPNNISWTYDQPTVTNFIPPKEFTYQYNADGRPTERVMIEKDQQTGTSIYLYK